MPEIAVLDSTMYYLDRGDGNGPPLVFLHGNPGSSYTWRRVFPHVNHGRMLAPDLIGMGRSGKPDIPYLFADHARYLDAWIDTLELDQFILIGHNWGGALACDWAARHPDRVRGLALMESFIKPMAWDELPALARARCEAIFAPGTGEDLVLNQDLYIRQAYTGGVLNPLAEDDLERYLAPYPTPGSRRPVLAWARQIPLGGRPAELVTRMRAYGAWLMTSRDVPKLLLTFHGSPTLFVDEAMVAWCAANVTALETVACGAAGHYATEDRPQEIAAALSAWFDRHFLDRTAPDDDVREESCTR